MIQMMKKIALIFLITYMGDVIAHEEYCDFDKGKVITLDERLTFRSDNGRYIFSVIFPNSDNGVLHRIDLFYGTKSKDIVYDVDTMLGFYIKPDHYLSRIILTSDHKPIKMRAIYHFNGCYSTLEAYIKNGKFSIKQRDT